MLELFIVAIILVSLYTLQGYMGIALHHNLILGVGGAAVLLGCGYILLRAYGE